MAPSDPHTLRREGLTLDVWCDLEEELPLVEAELAAMAGDGQRLHGDERRRLAALHHELGRLQLHAGDEAAAARSLQAAYALAPRFRPNLRAAQGLYGLRGDHKLLCRLLGAEAAASQEPAARSGLLRRQAHLLWARLDRPDEARAVLEEAHRLLPGDLATLKLLELLCAATGDLAGAEQQLRMQIRLLPPSPQAAALLTCRAALAAAHDPDKALAALRRAVDIAPDSAGAAGAMLEQLLEEQSAPGEEAAELLERLARQEGTAPRRRARLLARAARALGPDSERARALQEESLALHPSPALLEELLEERLREGDLEQAAALNERLLETDLPRAEARRLHGELGDMARASRPEEAARHLLLALELDPGHLPALESLELLDIEQDELLRRQRGAAEAAACPEDRRDALLALAHTLELGGSPEEAAAVHGELLARWPELSACRQDQVRLHIRLERWTELLQLYDEMLDEAAGEERVRILERMAGVWRRQLGEIGPALECHQLILKDAPGHLPSIRAAARLCAEAGEHREQVRLLEQEAALTASPVLRADLLCAAGRIWQDRLEDGAREARRCHVRALEEDPGCADAQLALGEHEAEPQAPEEGPGKQDPAHTPTIKMVGPPAPAQEDTALTRTVRVTSLSDLPGDDSGITRTVMVPLTSADGARARLLDGARAPGEQGGELARRARERALRLAGDPAELEVLLLERLERGEAGALERACLHAELADLAGERGDEAEAEESFERALACFPGHPLALWGKARLLTRQGRWPEVASTFLAEAETMESPRCRQDALIRAGMVIEEHTAERPRAEELYRRVLDEEPLHEEANERLAACLEAEEQWLPLAALLRARINAATSPQRTASFLGHLGRVYCGPLAEERKGLACLRRALELDPDNEEVKIALADRHYARQEWAEAEELYTRSVSTVGEPRERARIQRRLGEMQLGMDMPLAALSSLKQVDLAEEEPNSETLHLLLRAARAARDVPTQRDALERLLTGELAPDARVELLEEAARLLDEEVGKPRQAIALLEEAEQLAPLDIVLIEHLAAVHGSRGDRDAVDRHLTAAAARVRAALASDPLAAEVYQHLGRIHKWRRQYDAFFCTCVARAHLEAAAGQTGLLDRAERRFLKLHQYRSAPVPSGRLSGQRYEQLLLPAAARGAARALLLACRQPLHRLVSSTPAALGLDAVADRVTGAHPLRALCDEVAAALNGVQVELYTSRSRRRLVAAEVVDGNPALIIGEQVARGLISPGERYLIGRALYLIGEGAMPLLDMTSQRLAVTLRALGLAASPACDLPLGEDLDQEAVAREAERLTGELELEERERLGAVLPPLCPRLEGLDLAGLRAALERGANRAGLAVAADPLRALQAAARLEGGDGVGPVVADLLSFLVDPRFLALRRDLGLAPGIGE